MMRTRGGEREVKALTFGVNGRLPREPITAPVCAHSAAFEHRRPSEAQTGCGITSWDALNHPPDAFTFYYVGVKRL